MIPRGKVYRNKTREFKKHQLHTPSHPQVAGEKDYCLKVGLLRMLMHAALITRGNPSLEADAGSALHGAVPHTAWDLVRHHALCAALGWAGRGWALRAGRGCHTWRTGSGIYFRLALAPTQKTQAKL